MRSRVRRIGAILLLALWGCGTIQDVATERRIYGGVRRDLELRSFPRSGVIGNDPTFLLLIVDLPLCAVADTLLLPLTLPSGGKEPPGDSP